MIFSVLVVVGSIPTVARHIFQACPVWMYTQSNITSMNTNILYFSNFKTHECPDILSNYFPILHISLPF
jgi:hypothetical protein